MADLDLTGRDGYTVEAAIDGLTGYLHLIFRNLDETEVIASIIIEPEKALTVTRSLAEIARQLTPPGTPGVYKSRTIFDKNTAKGTVRFSPI